MTRLIGLKKKASLDKKIDLFCQTSAELLANIHTRCDKTAEGVSGKKAKRGRKKKAKDFDG
jgi:hypothetical protein